MAAAAALASCGMLDRGVGPPRAVLGKAPEAARVGSLACRDCHDTTVAGLEGTLHGTVPLDGDPGGRMCETCHGPGADHVDSYDPAFIFGRGDWEALGNGERTAACLSCHETMASAWTSSPHDTGEISCWNCHDDAFHIEPAVKGPVAEPATPSVSPDEGRFCFQCHADVEQEFLLEVQHPVGEGSMGCTSCHGPHGEDGTVETASDVSAVCTKCHVEVEGPWIYEHDAMYDGCTACHLPHGSPNPKLLVQTGSGLCLQCHIDVTFPRVNGRDHSVFIGSGASCNQCHFEVHGSNASQSLAPGL